MSALKRAETRVRSGAATVRNALAALLSRSTVTLTLGPVSLNVAPRPVEARSAEPCELVRVATRTRETTR